LFARRDGATILWLCLLLILVLVSLVYTFVETVHAAQGFQQQYRAVRMHDVSAIQPWMTVHAISHFYRVPEDYLYKSLQVQNSTSLRHDTLYDIAHRKKQPVARVIDTVQDAIEVYRKTHPLPATPTPKPKPTPHSKALPRLPTPGGTNA